MGVRVRSIVRKAGRAEAGMALSEVLVAMVIFIALLLAILQLLDTTSAVAPKDQERNHALREAQVGVHRMVRELRQSYALNQSPQTASRMNVQVTAAGSDLHVLYDCNQPSPTESGLFACKRVRAAASGPVPTDASGGDVIIDRLLDPNVFTYSPDSTMPKYVQAKVRVPASGERKQGFAHDITLDDGFYMRNLNLLD